jgi:hypothetical protein
MQRIDFELASDTVREFVIILPLSFYLSMATGTHGVVSVCLCLLWKIRAWKTLVCIHI